MKHGEIVKNIRTITSPNIPLTVCVADNRLGDSRSNFLKGVEVINLFRDTLRHLGVHSEVQIGSVAIVPGKRLSECIREFIKSRATPNERPLVVFSGSPSTILACEALRDEYNINIVDLKDDDSSGPRSRHLREALFSGDFSRLVELKDMVAPGVFEFLNNSDVIDRIQILPDGEKRPWTAIK